MPPVSASRLVLGTARFGSDHGSTDAAGRVGDGELEAILELASAAGIVRLDTALEHGDAQRRLRPWVDRFAITAKVRARDADGIAGAIGQCLEHLAVTGLDEVLVHDWHVLDAGERTAAAEALAALQDEGIVDAVGVCAYEAHDLESALGAFAAAGALDAVQVPVSALDQRLEDADAVSALIDAGMKIEARSVLLRGLLVAPPSEASHPHVLRFQDACARAGVSLIAGAVGFVNHLPWVDEVVLGVATAAELREVIEACEAVPITWPVVASSFASDDLALLDPRVWAPR